MSVLVVFAPGRAECDDSLQVQTVGVPMALRSYVPGRWGLVKVVVGNNGDEDGVLPAGVHLQDNPSLRFGRDIWVPAHSSRTTWIPIHLPADLEKGIGQTTLTGRAGGKEFSNQARLIDERFPMALLTDRLGGPVEENEEQGDASDAYEIVLALRSSLDLSRQVIIPNERLLPPVAEGWDAIGHVIIAGDRLADDAAGQAALRQWLAEGGRIWIQLNSTPPETARSLLGDAFRVEVVDRVALSTLPEEFTLQASSGPERELEQEVELVRVLVDGAEVLSQVHGWPTSFAIPFGRGEVVVTTLGPRGWMRLRNKTDPQVDALKWTKYVANGPLRDLQFRFLHAPHAEPPSQDLQREYLGQKIGYQVPAKITVLSLLVGFCALITFAGAVLTKKHHLEHLSWLTLAGGIIAGGVIVALGSASRQSVPPTAAELQFVEAVPAADTIAAAGSLAIYQPDLNTVELTSPAGMRLTPQLSDLAGQVRQLTWTDLNRWHFEQMELPPGVRMFPTQAGLSASETPQAVARFGPLGLEGRLTPGVLISAEDALIAPAFGNPLAANLAADGTFHASPADLLATGQFTADELLSDEQLRRQTLAAAWFAGRPPGSPLHLVAWSQPLAESMRWADGTRRVGALLLSVPLTIQRTSADTSVAIPDALMDLRAVSGSSGRSAHFDNHKRRWQYPQLSTTATRLRWQLPAEVLPLKVDRATLTLSGNVPSRQLDVLAIRDDQAMPIAQRSSPSGQIEIDISDAEFLSLDDQGGITLEFKVGELSAQIAERTVANGTWSILSTTLDVWGRTLPAEAEDTP